MISSFFLSLCPEKPQKLCVDDELLVPAYITNPLCSSGPKWDLWQQQWLSPCLFSAAVFVHQAWSRASVRGARGGAVGAERRIAEEMGRTVHKPVPGVFIKVSTKTLNTSTRVNTCWLLGRRVKFTVASLINVHVYIKTIFSSWAQTSHMFFIYFVDRSPNAPPHKILHSSPAHHFSALMSCFWSAGCHHSRKYNHMTCTRRSLCAYITFSRQVVCFCHAAAFSRSLKQPACYFQGYPGSLKVLEFVVKFVLFFT